MWLSKGVRMPRPQLTDIRAAAVRIAPYAHKTPVLTCSTLDRLADAEIFFKCENFQKVGAFKFRGACNAVFSLDEDVAARGVATHSSGNHAQALALAARMRGIPAIVVMPRTAPKVKREAVLAYGAKVVPCEPTLAAREEGLAKVVAETGANFVHPYDDDRVIAGQGTAALELIGELGELDHLVTPVGGGGLFSGTLIVSSELLPKAKVFAGEPSGADDAFRSLEAGHIIPSLNPDTIADGLLTSLGERNFSIISELAAGILRVDDASILSAQRLIWERMKLVVETSSAVALAALLEHRSQLSGRRVGIILSGGNASFPG
jgi:threonine dehydratase